MNQQLQNLSMGPLAMDNEFKFSDEELILRFQKGDEQSYIELVNRYRDRLIKQPSRLRKKSCLRVCLRFPGQECASNSPYRFTQV